jgi:hypothetical protein
MPGRAVPRVAAVVDTAGSVDFALLGRLAVRVAGVPTRSVGRT